MHGQFTQVQDSDKLFLHIATCMKISHSEIQACMIVRVLYHTNNDVIALSLARLLKHFFVFFFIVIEPSVKTTKVCSM